MSVVKIISPVRPGLNQRILDQLLGHTIPQLMKGAADEHQVSLFVDGRMEPSRDTDVRPWSKVARIRNRIVDDLARNGELEELDYLCWVDADVVDLLGGDLLPRLIMHAGLGAAAPLVLIEHELRFYDWAAFVMAGKGVVKPDDRWAREGRQLAHAPPYWPDAQFAERVVPMDCVGTLYVVHADVYRVGVRHEDHPAFTDHWPICEWLRRAGRPVVCCRDLVAYHARLPDYGETWH